ncbi:MAG: SpoIIE family protein phosphatase [Ignavibacteriaceae bacterium]
MNFIESKFKRNIKLQAFIGFTFLFLIFKMIYPAADAFPWILINEFLVIAITSLLILYFIDLFKKKTINPVSLVMSVGIVTAIIFFMISFSNTIINGLFNDVSERTKNPDIVFGIITFIYALIILVSLSYIFLAFKEFFYLNKKQNANTYFNTMIVFIILAALTAFLKNDHNLSFIKNTFFIVAILLIVINSLKISWIAFVVKKEKLIILFLSIVIAILFTVNLINNSDIEIHHKILSQFSPALNQFFSIIMLYGIIYFSILFFTTLFHMPTAEAFDRKAQEVSSFQYFSKLIIQVLDFSELTETITDIGMKVCEAHAAWIALKEDNNLKIVANKNIGLVNAEKLTDYIFEKNIEKYDKTFILKLDRSLRTTELNENFSLAAISPLKAYNTLNGYLIVVKKENFIFDEEDKNAINTFSDYASVAIENSRLLEESIEKERLEKELDVAREIQRKIIPAQNPQYNKLEISSAFIPAFEVGGDYYDFFDIDQNRVAFVIADVSGKGISAAFIMAEIKGIFESLSKTIESPREILIKANQILQRTLDRKSFVSAAYGIIDLEEEKMQLARAGHCPILLLRDETAENLRPSGLGLGLDFGARFAETLEELELNLKENDTIVLYTDGISESKNSKDEDFGDFQFQKILLENNSKNADDITNSVLKEITLFSSNNHQHDDITLVILKWKPKINNYGEEEWQNLTPLLKNKVK